MNAKLYLKEFQDNQAIDDASIDSYRSMVGSLNAQLCKAAREMLDPNDEPAHFDRFLRQETA